MVIELRDAPVTYPAVFRPQRPDDAAGVAEAEHVAVAVALPLVVVRYLLYGPE